MTDPRVGAAIDNWSPRFVAQGVDPNDFARTTERVDDWEGWLPAWQETARMHSVLGSEARAAGYTLTAGEAFVRAALCHHFGKFLWFEDEDMHWAATDEARAALAEAHSCLDLTAERVEIDVDGGRVAGNLRRPPAVDQPPVVLLLPGLDSAKEEFFNWENVFLARGMATFSLDGPGQGETGRHLPIRADYEEAAAPVIDALVSRSDLDGKRLGVAGVSLGGYYAARVASANHHVRAAVAIGGPYNFGECWPRLSGLTRDAFRRHARAGDDDAARAVADGFDLEGRAVSIENPLLVIFGKLDRLIPWEHAVRLADEAPNADLVMYDHGNHVCNNIPYLYRPLAGDWLAERLAAV